MLSARWRNTEPVRLVWYLGKWAVLLTPVAVVTGSAVALFLWLLDRATEMRLEYGWLLWLLPLAGIGVAAAYRLTGRGVERGNNLVLDEIHQPAGGVPARIAPLILVATVVTHLFGGSAGREGTAVQIGGGIAGGLARLLRVSPVDVRVLLMAGVSAGFGAVFGTPVAGAVFALEVLTLGRMEYEALLPVLFAGLLADQTTAAWGINHTRYAIVLPERAPGTLPLDAVLMLKVLLAAVAFGLVAALFSELAHAAGSAFRRTVRAPLLRPAAGGTLVIALTYALGTRDYLGLGVRSPDPHATTIVAAFTMGGAAIFAWWWKIVFTAITLGSGFKGGEVTPLFFIGATLGNVLAARLHAPADLFAGLGFVAVFAAAANTPLACTVMGIELFGAAPASYLAVACAVAYLVSGHRGVYLSQRIGTGKVRHPSLAGHVTLRSLRSRQPSPSTSTDMDSSSGDASR